MSVLMIFEPQQVGSAPNCMGDQEDISRPAQSEGFKRPTIHGHPIDQCFCEAQSNEAIFS